MIQITTIGLDLAKRGFQVHGVDATGAVVLQRQLEHRQVAPFFKACVFIGSCRLRRQPVIRPSLEIRGADRACAPALQS